MTIDEQCQAALKRFHEWLNRSAAQHKRRYREHWAKQ